MLLALTLRFFIINNALDTFRYRQNVVQVIEVNIEKTLQHILHDHFDRLIISVSYYKITLY